MRVGFGLPVALLAAALSCQTTPEPLGEALVVLQTDVAIPRRVNRVRIEIFGADGALVDTRDVPTPMTEDWPVSFSVVIPEGARTASTLVRVRAWLDGHELSARELERLGRRAGHDTKVHASIADACAAAPALRLGRPLTLRRGSVALTELARAQQCTESTVSGSAVARLEITDRGEYRVEVERSIPDGATGEPGSDTAISLRRVCADATTQFECAENIGVGNYLSRIDRVTLDPGSYWVVTGGGDAAPADLTLRASRLDAFIAVPEEETPPLTADPFALEPMPGVTIDRLIALELRAGERGRADVVLHGECFGTPASLTERKTCVDVADSRVDVVAIRPTGDLSTVAPAPVPWVGDTNVPCSVEARPDEVCVPGGAFVLGDLLALEDLDDRSQPERMRVLEPFLVDRYEMSVGRFRDALARGFAPTGGMPLANEAAVLDENAPRGICTWSNTDVGRERFPLNCVTWATARSFCQFSGGDLLTEEQWEYAATAAGKNGETPYPWGDGLPTCETTVFARTSSPTAQCLGSPIGPVAVDDAKLVAGDVTPLGVIGLGGNVEELLASAFVPYSDPAWREAGLRRPVDEVDAPMRSSRGGDWAFEMIYATVSTRRKEPATARYSTLGFRCARKGRT